MNIRIFLELGNSSIIKNWWIGGGFDLTPYVVSNEDTSLWHNEAKLTLDEFNKTFYAEVDQKKYLLCLWSHFYAEEQSIHRSFLQIFYKMSY